MSTVDITPAEYARLEDVERGAAEAFLSRYEAGAGAPDAVVEATVRRLARLRPVLVVVAHGNVDIRIGRFKALDE